MKRKGGHKSDDSSKGSLSARSARESVKGQRHHQGVDSATGGFGSSGSSRSSEDFAGTAAEDEEEVRCEGATTSASSAAALYDQFTWVVRDVSKITEEYVYSEIFSIGGFQWRLLMYPKGNNNKSKALSVYLCVPDFQNLDPGWSRLAHFTLAVLNQKDPSKTHSCDGSNKFRKREHDWGFQSLMELVKLHDSANGFLFEDKIILQAKVQVVSHLYMPMSSVYRKELCQRHYKCALRFYFEEFLEEKLEEFDEFWEDNADDFLDFWAGLPREKRALLLQLTKDALLRKIRSRLFSEKHVDCNLALDVLYNAAEELVQQAAGHTVAVARTGGGGVAGPLFGVAIHISPEGSVLLADNGDFPDALQQARRDTLRIVKETLQIKKKADAVENEESKVAKLEEVGRRMFHVFAMELVFNEHLLVAYREKIARERQEELIREEEDEKRRDGERKAAKREKKAKKKAHKLQQQEKVAEEAAEQAVAEKVGRPSAEEEADLEIVTVGSVEEPRSRTPPPPPKSKKNTPSKTSAKKGKNGKGTKGGQEAGGQQQKKKKNESTTKVDGVENISSEDNDGRSGVEESGVSAAAGVADSEEKGGGSAEPSQWTVVAKGGKVVKHESEIEAKVGEEKAAEFNPLGCILGCITATVAQCVRQKQIFFRRKDAGVLKSCVFPRGSMFMVDFDTMMLHGLYDVVAIVDTETPQSKAAIKRPPNLPIQVTFDIGRQTVPLKREEWVSLVDVLPTREKNIVKISASSVRKLMEVFSKERKPSVPASPQVVPVSPTIPMQRPASSSTPPFFLQQPALPNPTMCVGSTGSGVVRSLNGSYAVASNKGSLSPAPPATRPNITPQKQTLTQSQPASISPTIMFGTVGGLLAPNPVLVSPSPSKTHANQAPEPRRQDSDGSEDQELFSTEQLLAAVRGNFSMDDDPMSFFNAPGGVPIGNSSESNSDLGEWQHGSSSLPSYYDGSFSNGAVGSASGSQRIVQSGKGGKKSQTPPNSYLAAATQGHQDPTGGSSRVAVDGTGRAIDFGSADGASFLQYPGDFRFSNGFGTFGSPAMWGQAAYTPFDSVPAFTPSSFPGQFGGGMQKESESGYFSR